MDFKKHLPAELLGEDGQMNIMSAAVIAVIGAAIMLMLGAYVITVLGNNLGDANVTLIGNDIVKGFTDAATFPGLVLIFVFIGVILTVVGGIAKQG